MSEDTANAQEHGVASESSKDGCSFEAITTQEQFDKAIKGRISRAEANTRKAVESEYADAIEKARRFDELEEKNKTELERERERAEKAEGELERMRRERQIGDWASEAASKHGVDASLLRGETLEELESHAEQIKAAIDAVPRMASVPNSGKPSSAADTDDGELDAMLRKAAGLKTKG